MKDAGENTPEPGEEIARRKFVARKVTAVMGEEAIPPRAQHEE